MNWKEIDWKATLKSYAIITLACIPYAVGFDWFYSAGKITCGGLIGIAQIIHTIVPSLGVGAMVFCMNLPLFLWGFYSFGFPFVVKSLYAVFVSSTLIDTVAALHTFTPVDPILSCVYGGVMIGSALGLLLRQEATTGGTELGARLLKQHIPRLSIGRICLVLDLCVIVSYSLLLGTAVNALYGGASLFISTQMIDRVVYGGKAAKLVYIMSEKRDRIEEKLLEAGIGVTQLHARGGYTQEENDTLLCAVRLRQIVSVKRTVEEIDPKAFLILCDAREVFGKGFEQYRPDGM